MISVLFSKRKNGRTATVEQNLFLNEFEAIADGRDLAEPDGRPAAARSQPGLRNEQNAAGEREEDFASGFLSS